MHDKHVLIGLKEKRSDLVSLLIIALHIIFVLAPIYIATLTSPGWHYALLWLWFGVAANGLTLLLHECSHYLTFLRRKWTVLLGKWFLGPLLLTDFDIYRKRHWIHHTKLGQPLDTKKTYLIRIDGLNALVLFFRIMFLYEALQAVLRQFFQLAEHPSSSEGKHRVYSVSFLPLITFHMLFAFSLGASIFSVHEPTFSGVLWHFLIVYAGIYMYGLATLTILMAHVRAVAEHSATIARHGKPVGVAALRTMKVNPLTRLIFGGYGFADHAAHHLYPDVPYYQLPQISARLCNHHTEFQATHGYLQLMWDGFWSKNSSLN